MSLITYERRRRELYQDESGIVPGVPSVEDHTDPAWNITTDIYKGEIYINGVDDKVYTRTDNGIILIGGSPITGGGGLPTDSIRYNPYIGSNTPTLAHTKLINVALDRLEMWYNSTRVPLIGYDSKVSSNILANGSITFVFQIKTNSTILIQIY